MILRRRKKPIELEKLDALIPRIKPRDTRLPDIKYAAARINKGYIGEKKVDYHLDQLANSHTILQDVNLRTNGQSFQIDTLIISDYAIYIVEVKNYSGTITFDTILRQLIRNDGQEETGFRYPITQAETNQLKLMNWLQERNTPHIPIRYFIGISEPSTIIKVIGDEEEIASVVAHGEYIPHKILQVDDQLKEQRLRNRAEKGSWNDHQIGQLILRECGEQNVNILRKLNISLGDILPGVICPKCERLGMNRLYGKWKCGKCQYQSKNAHKRTLNDFFLLIKPSITNRECRWLLCIHSRHLAQRILQQSNYQYLPQKGIWVKPQTS